MAEAAVLSYTKAEIVNVTVESPDTFTFSFKLGDGRGPADFPSGRFNMLYVPGVGEVPISIASSTSEPLLKHTVKAVGTVTNLLLKMKAGDTVGLRGPYGTAWPVYSCLGRDLLVISGGCGLPAVRPVILDALARPKKFRSVSILYGARTPQDLLYKPEYDGWNKVRGVKLYVTVDKAEDGWPETLQGAGRTTCETSVGVVSALLQKVDNLSEGAKAFVCGPEIMMKFTVQELLKKGLAPDDIILSLERHMSCAQGTCGHCQVGSFFICRDGPVLPYAKVRQYFAKEGV